MIFTERIFFVAAMNPVSNEPAGQRVENFTGINSTRHVFAVRAIPQSMEELVLDFGTFTPDQESSFLQVLLGKKRQDRSKYQICTKTKWT